MSKSRKLILLLIISSVAIFYVYKTDLLAGFLASQEVGLAGEGAGEITTHYKNLLAKHLEVDKQAMTGSVIFLGDSITEGFNLSQISVNSVNFGISMDTTVGLMKRIPNYHSLINASAIVILIGVNDIYRFKRNPDTITENYKVLLSMLPEGKPVFFCDVLPVDERLKWHKVPNKTIKAINDRLGLLVASYEHVMHVPLFKNLLDETGNLSKEFHGGDGVHLNAKGYRLLTEHISKQLKEKGINLKLN